MSSHRQCVLPNIENAPHSLGERNVVRFYCCLLDSIMYITLTKATFIVIEIINPIIKNIRKSNI